MNKKLSLLVPGALMLILSAAPVVAVFTEAATAAPVRVAERGREGMKKLNLTDAQKAKMKEIRESTRAKMDAVLTETQKQQLQTAKQNRQKPNLNLSEDQKAKIKVIREDAKRQMDAVLTPEQRQQMQQMREQMKQRRQMKNPQMQNPQ
jgi:protein CpxP